MKFNPHDYQKYAIQFLIQNKAAALLLDMGLGKTVITLTALWELAFDYFDIEKVLIIAPKRVAESTWRSEIEKWEHLRGLTYSIVLGTKQQRENALNQKALLYIINRENVSWLIKNHNWDFDAVVIDELSSFKSNKAERFKALKKVRPYVKRIIGLTGTPAPNSLMDLWAEIYLLDMGERLGRFIGGFRERFFIPDKRNQQIVFSYKPKDGAEEKIYSLISDICISMKALDHLEMPKLVNNNIAVKMNSKEQKIYDKFKADMVLSLDGSELDAVNAAALSNKLLQMSNGAVYADDGTIVKIHDRKLDALEDLIEAANGKPLLVAYWYKHDKQKILERFNAAEINTAADIEKWNKGEVPVALIHPASAGHGLNLQQGGSTVVWFGLTWSLELYQQLNARLYRQGQKNTVFIHHIITKNTIDENVIKALEKKNVSQNSLIDAVKARLMP
ncbi:MAG: DEAD/DEAH box helicase [Clostridiales bacterium]|nr:DEAD/DEAH box helicase [Clostridiales bacterium]